MPLTKEEVVMPERTGLGPWKEVTVRYTKRRGEGVKVNLWPLKSSTCTDKGEMVPPEKKGWFEKEAKLSDSGRPYTSLAKVVALLLEKETPDREGKLVALSTYRAPPYTAVLWVKLEKVTANAPGKLGAKYTAPPELAVFPSKWEPEMMTEQLLTVSTATAPPLPEAVLSDRFERENEQQEKEKERKHQKKRKEDANH